MELWDLYTKDRQRTGLFHERGKPVPEGYYRLVVHVCVFNSRGEMLIQKRHPEKGVWPGLWDLSAGGSAIAGDTSASAATRELYEELGISHSFLEEHVLLTIGFDNGFDDYYLLREDVAPESLTLQPEEVVAVRYAGRDEVLAMCDRGEFIPYQRPLIDLLFEAGKVGHAHIMK